MWQWQMHKSMKKGLWAATLGVLAFVAPQTTNADGPKDSKPPAKEMMPKGPGVGRDGGHGTRRVVTRTRYRAICKSGSHRLHPWSGPVRDNLSDAYRDARRHERDHRGHEADLEIVEEMPQHPAPKDPVRPLPIAEKTKDRHGKRTIDQQIVPPGPGR
jgi:hypothetical protein